MTTPVLGFETPVTAWDQDTTWLLNLTNISFEPGDPEVGVTFMAPPSGRVMTVVGGGARDNTGTNRVFMGRELFIGTQPIPENVVNAEPNEEFVVPGQVTESIYGSRVTIDTGLTPLAVHYVRHTHRVTGGNTGDIFVRELLVVPLP